MKLAEIVKKYSNQTIGPGGTDKDTDHSYVSEFYEKEFSTFDRDAPISILEVGTYAGWSVAAWLEYFPKATVYAVDLQFSQWNAPEDQRVIKIQGDATDPSTFDTVGKIDIVIDDGSHRIEDQIKTFEILKDRVLEVYIIEDVTYFDSNKKKLEEVGISEFYDLREVKDRHDDVLAVFRPNEK